MEKTGQEKWDVMGEKKKKKGEREKKTKPLKNSSQQQITHFRQPLFPWKQYADTSETHNNGLLN